MHIFQLSIQSTGRGKIRAIFFIADDPKFPNHALRFDESREVVIVDQHVSRPGDHSFIFQLTLLSGQFPNVSFLRHHRESSCKYDTYV